MAETEHLPTASNALHVTPSALSRTIRLLEEQLGRPLFDRKGRRIQLNLQGETFLRAVRDAMRLIDEGVSDLEGKALQGPVHVAVPGPFAPLYVLPAIESMAERHPGLVAHVHAMSGERANGALRRGEIDIAVIDDPLPDEQLRLDRLRDLEHDVFVHPDAPRQLGALPFVAPIANPRGVTPDAWPLDRARTIALRVTRMQVAIDAVRTGRYTAALPAPVGVAQGLRPLGMSDQLGRTALYVSQRPSLPGIETRAEVLVRAIRELAR